ncbi:SDR family NAD(P)-dependent oxidoreductase [Parerythrobacter jejuensis]|uniref:SDR family NAD(P)-dependent oxidoreductase n=1 Tax=Parerythrobacter jejuensis TaxID=795812 RepID=A0A845ATI6_9SPHN|nr:SDR family oxidoreductase [Parerythrobacter jejuensis]MXP32819.1 SDR family NAD(P)-dependent oxidoreductase [Parerythrobacter jejuensis]
MTEFSGKVAAITGGASGIGLAIARKLVALGGSVVLGDIDDEKLENAATELGGNALTVRCDTSDLASVEAFAEAAFGWQGRVDLLLNNAGVGGVRGKLWEVDPEAARAHFDVNFWGVWNGCRTFAPRMIAQEHSSAIYNTGSENSFFCAVPQTAAYIAAKHAVLGMTESFREDLPEHVHAGLIIPGWVFTPLGEERFMKFGMDVADYAEIVVPQLLANERFVVSHSYNTVRVNERIDALNAAYEQYASRQDGDEAHDVRTVLAALTQKRS